MPASRTDVIVALAAPAAVVAVDVGTGVYSNLWGIRSYAGVGGDTPFAALTVAKVAALAWVVGLRISAGWLRTIVFVWCVALVDLGLFARFINGGGAMLVALTTAEVGVLLCWSVLADTRWIWRLPVALLALAAILPIAVWGLDDSLVWTPLLTIGVVFQAAVYATLGVRGFRIARVPTEAKNERGSLSGGASQFGVKHLLIWSAALPPLLVVIRLLDWRLAWWLRGYGAVVAEAPDCLTLGVAIAAGSLSMVGVVLGSGPTWARVAAGVAISSLIGYALNAWSAARYEGLAAGAFWPNWRTIARLLIDMRDGWTPWCLLAFGLLAALLLFLRASGYRLQRQR